MPLETKPSTFQDKTQRLRRALDDREAGNERRPPRLGFCCRLATDTSSVATPLCFRVLALSGRP